MCSHLPLDSLASKMATCGGTTLIRSLEIYPGGVRVAENLLELMNKLSKQRCHSVPRLEREDRDCLTAQLLIDNAWSERILGV